MNVKLFQIKTAPKQRQKDEEAMNEFMEKVKVKRTAAQFLNGKQNYWSILIFFEPDDGKQKTTIDSKLSYPTDSPLSQEELRIFNTLKLWRRDKASALNIPSYMICSDRELTTIAKIKPQTVEELAKIKGFGPTKTSKFGEEIISTSNAV